jgi:hypothetical protein
MLYTLVDPHRGHEVAYNRWYERDHFYGGCMIGPGILAGGRWVATAELKALRTPPESSVAVPVEAGSYLATYFIGKGMEAEHFAWSSQQVFDLYESGRGFEERDHAHTALYLHKRSIRRDPDGVPPELALDHRFPGLVTIHLDRPDECTQREFDDWLEAHTFDLLGTDSSIALVLSWAPILPRAGDPGSPMKLGSGPGTPARTLLMLFCDTDCRLALDEAHQLCDAMASTGATIALCAPFQPTNVGTDDYTGELWME